MRRTDDRPLCARHGSSRTPADAALATGAALTAAEVTRELRLTHANAGYHLRNLLASGPIVQDGEERIRGGTAKRYRYDAARDRARDGDSVNPPHAGAQRALFAAVANELIRVPRRPTGPPAAP
jgi:predicted ArsR family transcriptional regulator